MAVHQKEDHSLNDINRDLIKAMDGYYGQVYVGSINGPAGLVKYNGEKIYNAELETLLRQWKEQNNVCRLDAIYERIRELDGHLLLWV